MFPYPSGAGLHVGHPLGYIATDVVARFNRMLGKNVLHCLGYDAFGLPAEQYAVQTGQHPRKTTEDNIVIMARQLRRLGLGHDDRRAIQTIDPEYYRWTQWIFLQIYNSWYDADAVRPDGGVGRARPIDELVEEYRSGARPLPADDGRGWDDLSDVERAGILDGQRLAYTSEAPVNWCPGLGTVLSNEEVTNDGRSERGNFPVFKRNLRQWMMRITSYADRLADDLDRRRLAREGQDHAAQLDRPQPRRPGHLPDRRRTGCRRGRRAAPGSRSSRPDRTPCSARPSWCWPPSTRWSTSWSRPAAGRRAPRTPGPVAPRRRRRPSTAYRRAASRSTDIERQTEGKDKTGVFTGGWATNPVTGARIPVFVADYVLMGYGTGAIMAVPGQDQRDWDFATAFDLPIIRTVQPSEGHDESTAFTGEGPAINSSNDELSLDGLDVADAKERITAWLQEQGPRRAARSPTSCATGCSAGSATGASRSRSSSTRTVSPTACPTRCCPSSCPRCPTTARRPTTPTTRAASPSRRCRGSHEWVHVDLDLGDGRGTRRYRRETNTMPNWAGSCWYYLRYLDPANSAALVDPDNESYWMGPRAEPVAGAPAGTRDPGGVDLYVGGVEHAVLHLLYARFWHKVLHDLGHLSSDEPFRTYFSQGYIQAAAFKDARGQYVEAKEVEEARRRTASPGRASRSPGSSARSASR